MNVGSLFTGVGGLDLALEQRGHRVAWHAEIDDAPASVLAHHWPDVPNLGDVTSIDWKDGPRVDVIAGGFPCQDISYAGRGAGLAGDRSGLWWVMFDAIRVLRPRWVVLENVAAILARGGPAVVGALAGVGYDCRWGVVRASDAGAPHRRSRWFCVARDTEREGCEGAGLRRAASERRGDAADGTSEGWRPEKRGALASLGTEAARQRPPELGRRGDVSADASDLGHERGGSARRRGHGPADHGEPASDADHNGRECVRWEPGHVRQPRDDPHRRGVRDRWSDTPYEAAIARWEHVTGEHAPEPTVAGRLNPDLPRWMMGLPAGWLDGLTRTQALRAAGNAVCPQQAALALDLLDAP